MCSVLTAPVEAYIPQPSLDAVVGVEILQVLKLWVAEGRGGVDESVFGAFGAECAARDIDGARGAVVLCVAAAVVGFKLGLRSVVM